MAQPQTGLLFRSVLSTHQMAKRLEGKFPETAWRLGDSDQYRTYYVAAKRGDGVTIRIEPEDEADEYYLGVYFGAMPEIPNRDEQLAGAQQIHQEVLAVVEGVPVPSRSGAMGGIPWGARLQLLWARFASRFLRG